MAYGTMIAAMDFSKVDAGEFNDWYDTEHFPERAATPGFLTAQRWIGVDNPAQSVVPYDLESLAVLDGPTYRSYSGDNASPWTRRVTSPVERMMRYTGVQMAPGDGLAPAEAEGLLVVAMTPSPAVEAGFNAWYDDEHLPALARVPGVLKARRFCSSGGPGLKYVALYHLTGPEVVESAGWKDAAGSTPMPDNIRAGITDRLRLVCRRYVRG